MCWSTISRWICPATRPRPTPQSRTPWPRGSLPGTAGSGDSPLSRSHQPPGPEHLRGGGGGHERPCGRRCWAAWAGAASRYTSGIQHCSPAILPYERGMIDAGIARIDEETINRMADDNAGQPARTAFEVLGYGARAHAGGVLALHRAHPFRSGYICGGWAIRWPGTTSTAGILI